MRGTPDSGEDDQAQEQFKGRLNVKPTLYINRKSFNEMEFEGGESQEEEEAHNTLEREDVRESQAIVEEQDVQIEVRT